MVRMQPNEALRDGFDNWLDEVVTPRRPKRRSRPRTGPLDLDPYETSMRRSYSVAPRLAEIRDAGTPHGAANPRQAVTDLRSLGLVAERSGVNSELSAMGQKVLDRWESLSIMTEDSETAEIARSAILYREGCRSLDPVIRDEYSTRMAWYKYFTAQWPVSYWVQDLFHLYMPLLLAQTDSRGFNPFKVLVATNKGAIGDEDEWHTWANAQWAGSSSLQGLLGRVSGSRPGGLKGFILSLAACDLADTDAPAYRNFLEERAATV